MVDLITQDIFRKAKDSKTSSQLLLAPAKMYHSQMLSTYTQQNYTRYRPDFVSCCRCCVSAYCTWERL